MKPPKQKPPMSKPKTLIKSVRSIGGVKNKIDKTTDTINKANKAQHGITKHMPSEQEQRRPEEYATDSIIQKTSTAAKKVGGKTVEETKHLAKKGVEKAREHHEIKQKDKYDNKFEADVKRKQADSAKRSLVKVRHTADKSRKKAKSAIHTGKKTNKSVKSASKTVKMGNKAVKTTKKGIKTAKRTAKTTKTVVKNAKRAAAAVARKAAIATAKAIKTTVKAAITAVKVAIAAIKGLVAVIAAGGWIAVVVIIIIAVIIAVISSPLAMFSNDTDGTASTISQVIQDINAEYSNIITNIIVNAGEVNEVIIEGETATAGYIPTNWIDVLAVFSVKATINDNPNEYMDVAIMDDKKIKSLKSIFWEMNNISYEIQEEIVPTPEPTPSPTPTPSVTPTTTDDISPTPEPTPEVIRTLIITMENKTYEQGADIYNFNEEQLEILEELMSPQYLALFMEICGMDSFNGLTPRQLANLINDLPEGELGAVIVEYALTRLGHPYSRTLRGQGNYVDCSYLARWAYQEAGVSRFTAGTAAEQARYCVNNGLTISKSDLKMGDLIFWSFTTNGRFMNISHVGIYAGNGMVIDASSSRGMVVYREIFGASSQVLYGRPHVE